MGKIDNQSDDCNTSAVKASAGSTKNTDKAVSERNQPRGASGKK